MGRRDPTYRIMNHLMNFALDVAEKKIEQRIQKPDNTKYLPAVREQEIAKNDITSLIKVDRPQIYFDKDIGGLREAKEALKLSVVYPRIRKDLYSLYEKPLGNVLLYGPPGCGKTLLAKAVSNECGWLFIYPHMGDIVKKHVGDREKAVSSIFDYSRSMYENSILFLDELEQLVLRNGPPYVQRIKDEFQIQMDGIDSKRGFPVVIGASNKPWLIDTPMRRPGRFDKLIFVPPPNLCERKDILRIGLDKLLYKGMIEGDYEMLLSDLAERTENFSGADLVSLIDSAKDKPLSEAVRNGFARRIRKEDFEDVLQNKKSSTTSWFSDAVRACKRYEEKDLLEEIMKFYPKNN
jgi:SpoVK/Ycf46/Vps4 family AAA+-type ATPase